MANLEQLLESKYFEEFKIIDGLNQHPDGLNFEEWKNKYYPTRTKLMAVRR